MRRSVRDSWPFLLVLTVSACSLMVDFPERHGDGGYSEERNSADATVEGIRRDAGGKPDAGRDASGPNGKDGSGGGDGQSRACDTSTHAGCAANQLCCNRVGQGATCVDVSAEECTACGGACGEAAPSCATRGVCECQPGSGEGCPSGQQCVSADGSARCVECMTDADCASHDGKQCVSNRCVQCDRGAKLDDSSDDEGCSNRTRPVCNAQNTCEACGSDSQCASGQRCVSSSGCVGCDPVAAIGSNGCGGTSPICKQIAGDYQCVPCVANPDCKGAYCDERSGSCTNACDPDLPGPGGNGCPNTGTPYCNQTATSYACEACTVPFCATLGRRCQTAPGPRQGQCVVCRNDDDCPMSAPECNAQTGQCRSCPEGTRFDNTTGQCVQIECTRDADCNVQKGGLFCHPTKQECVQCTGLPVPDSVCTGTPATPHCGANGVCAACASDAQCSGATPICVSGSCQACSAAPQPDRCRQLNPNTPICGSTGSCVRCTPSQSTPQDQGCDTDRPDCVDLGGARGLTCLACDPGPGAAPVRCGEGMCTPAGTCAAGGPPPDAGAGPDPDASTGP